MFLTHLKSKIGFQYLQMPLLHTVPDTQTVLFLQPCHLQLPKGEKRIARRITSGQVSKGWAGPESCSSLCWYLRLQFSSKAIPSYKDGLENVIWLCAQEKKEGIGWWASRLWPINDRTQRKTHFAFPKHTSSHSNHANKEKHFSICSSWLKMIAMQNSWGSLAC